MCAIHFLLVTLQTWPGYKHHQMQLEPSRPNSNTARTHPKINSRLETNTCPENYGNKFPSGDKLLSRHKYHPDAHCLDTSGEKQHPDVSRGKHHPDVSGDKHHPDMSGDKHCLDASRDKHRLNVSRDKHHPATFRDKLPTGHKQCPDTFGDKHCLDVSGAKLTRDKFPSGHVRRQTPVWM